MGFLEKIPYIGRFFEQKALVGDAVNSLFHSRVAKHPRELKTYKKYYDEDNSVGVSIDTLSEMIAGVGHYATVEDEEKGEKALEYVNELAKQIRLDEKLLNITKCMLIYGFCPVERTTHRGPPGGILSLQVLHPPSVKYKRDSKGKIEGYIQEITGEKPVSFKPDELIWFVYNEVGNAAGVLYGTSKIARVLNLLEIRDQIIENINGIMVNQSRPPVIWKTKSKGDVETLTTLLQQCKESGKDPVLYPMDSIAHEIVKIDSRSPYWEYVEYVDGLIFEGLHAPILNYLRNATEASANSMLDAIQRHVEGIQRYIKRVVEHDVYEWHLKRKGWAGEIPSFNWGSPKTGVEDLDTASIVVKGLENRYIDRTQFLDLLKQLGLSLPEPEEEEEPEEPELPLPEEPPFPPQDPELANLTKEEKKTKIALYKKLTESQQPNPNGAST